MFLFFKKQKSSNKYQKTCFNGQNLNCIKLMEGRTPSDEEKTLHTPIPIRLGQDLYFPF